MSVIASIGQSGLLSPRRFIDNEAVEVVLRNELPKFVSEDVD